MSSPVITEKNQPASLESGAVNEAETEVVLQLDIENFAEDTKGAAGNSLNDSVGATEGATEGDIASNEEASDGEEGEEMSEPEAGDATASAEGQQSRYLSLGARPKRGQERK